MVDGGLAYSSASVEAPKYTRKNGGCAIRLDVIEDFTQPAHVSAPRCVAVAIILRDLYLYLFLTPYPH